MIRFKAQLLELAYRLRPFALHFAVLGIAILLGLGMGAISANRKPPATEIADHWSLPQWAPYLAGAKRVAAISSVPWAEDQSKKKPEELAKVDVPPWRFIGTVVNGKARLAVIELEQGKKIQRLGPGDALPNGAAVVAIEIGELKYMENDSEKTIKLFSPEKIPTYAATVKKK